MFSALLLGAGLGSRLRPLTDDRPKCLVELDGEPLAMRVLRQLGGHGVRRATVVIGHHAERARALLPPRLGAMEITLVENPVFAETNTMYSTLLAIDALADGGFLVEGDIAASDAAIARLASWRGHGSCWAADPWRLGHAGSRLHADGGGRLVGQDIHRDPTSGPEPGHWKSAGMLKLSPRDVAVLGDRLRVAAGHGARQIYYDDVIGRHVGDFELDVLDLTGAPWVEIDDHADLAEARRVFEIETRA